MEFKKEIEITLETLKDKGYDRAVIEQELNYSENYIDQVLAKGGNSRFAKAIKKFLADVLQKETSGLVLPITSYQEKRRNQKNTTKDRRIPFYDAEAAAGITETDMSPIHAPAGTIDVGDLLHDSQAAIRIYGNSMLPNYPPGCVVGLNKVTQNFIEPGEVYVIETSDRRVLKRLFYKDDDSNSNHFMLYSDNTMKYEGGARDGKLAYPPTTIPKSMIVNLFVVTGVIKRNTNSVIINRKS